MAATAGVVTWSWGVWGDISGVGLGELCIIRRVGLILLNNRLTCCGGCTISLSFSPEKNDYRSDSSCTDQSGTNANPRYCRIGSLEGFGVGEGTNVVIGVKMVALDDIFIGGAELDIVLAGVWVGVLGAVVGIVLGIDA